VDIESSRPYVELKEKGFDSNEFQASLFRRIEEGQNPVPIQERTVHLKLAYPGSVEVDAPQGTTGKLTTFLSVFREAMADGFLAPAEGDRIIDCRRVAKTNV
jgi:hypothetical protein